ncbi:MAG: S41 family peptidase [Candidatus Kapabacteria bacterium]|nr:S41 family peptidase [Candidatus Kapabacteria bacterium]
MKASPRSLIIIAAAAVLVGIGLGVAVQPVVSGDNVYEQVRKFSEVLNMATRNYVDEVDTQKLTEAAIRGMLEELDPHSVYITAKDMVKVEEDFKGSFEGIGVEFDIVSDTITIVSPIVGGPSEALGIAAGDKIVRINDTSAVGMTRETVPKKLRGQKGTVVKIHIRRTGEKELLVFDITRDKIPLNSVDAYFMIDGTDIGYVTANRFSATTYDEIMRATRELRGKGMKKLLLDLRNNPGGYLDQAFRIADEFIPEGQKLVYTKGRRPEFDEDFMSTEGGSLEDIPLVVMINGGSASASEIVSGAIQDLDRGLVVGETSFGKGLVQRQYPLGDGSAYRLTISKYYTPSGRLIQRPYKDKTKYYEGEGRVEGDEGENITHEADVKDTNLKDRPKFKTLSGRTVYGGGGIMPDYIVKPDTIAMLARKLRSKNLFWTTADDIMRVRGKDLRQKYGQDMSAFLRTFTIGEADVKRLQELAKDKEVEWNADEYAKDQSYIQSIIKAYIGRMLFNNAGFTATLLSIDSQAAKAMTLFSEAARISKRR